MENNFDINKASPKHFWREIDLYKRFENDIANQIKDLEILKTNITCLENTINEIDKNIFNLQNQAKELQIQVENQMGDEQTNTNNILMKVQQQITNTMNEYQIQSSKLYQLKAEESNKNLYIINLRNKQREIQEKIEKNTKKEEENQKFYQQMNLNNNYS
jgi:chromosome segregation ATPase